MAHISRREFLKAITAGTIAGASPSIWRKRILSAAPVRPNVILFIADQFKFNAMSMTDQSFYTPSLDAIADKGVTFSNCFATSPICAPSRASLLTGKPPRKTGVLTNSDFLKTGTFTLGNAFANNNYQTAYLGKWHLRSRPTDFGFQYVSIGNKTVRDMYETSRKAREYITKISLEKPFFLVISWQWPHPPMTLIEKYADLFPLDSIPIPPSFTDVMIDKPEWYRNLAAKYNLSTEKLRSYGKMYRTMTRQVDHWIGSIMRRLKERGLLECTIIAFTSDHGNMLGAHRLLAKYVPFDESLKVPFMLYKPGLIPTRKVIDDLISNASIAGTILEAAGLEVSKSFVGGSVMQRIYRETPPTSEMIFFEYYPEHLYYGVRTRDYKYIFRHNEVCELYDLRQDPLELSNEINNPDYGKDIQLLHERLLIEMNS